MMNKPAPLKTENVFHQLLKEAKARPKGEVWGVCVSGGMDSVALFQLIVPIAKITGHELRAFHIHHGRNVSEKQLKFRDGARQFVKALCRELEVSFFTNDDATTKASKPPEKQNEESLRDYRWECLKRLTHGENITFLTGHHLDDVLETRLIQLLRGVGPEAFTQFRASSPGVWRPLFSVSKQELSLLALRQNWKWFEDPSNKATDPLRNWMRLEWLPLLEQKRPGGSRTLHRSLELIIESLNELKNEATLPTETPNERQQVLSRLDFETLSRQRQRQTLAQVLRKQGVKGYTKGQLEEVLKRLESPQKEFEFKISQMLWKVNKSSIHISRV